MGWVPPQYEWFVIEMEYFPGSTLAQLGEAVMKDFVSPIWMTYRQASELGGQVRKGEHGSLVVYANKITKTTKTLTGDDVDRDIHFMKGYTVFNVEQLMACPRHIMRSS
jgi:antirestriction protein ArdC